MLVVPFKHHIIGLGNPLLDYIIAQPDLLTKYGLKDDDSILAEPKHDGLFDYLINLKDVMIVAGGAAQNSIRYSQYLLPEGSTGYIGCVGKDKVAELLRQENKKDGVESHYMEVDAPTGVCASIVNESSRSLVARLGAASQFDPKFLEEIAAVIDKGTIFYLEGHMISVTPETLLSVGKKAVEGNKYVALNLSAPYVPSVFFDKLFEIMKYSDYVIGNESEALCYAEAAGIKSTDIAEIAKQMALVEKPGSLRPRTVIITQGPNEVLVAMQDKDEVIRVPVPPLDSSLIVDAIGAGDAFAGGFLAGVAQNKTLEDCVKLGIWMSGVSLKQLGAKLPDEKLQPSV